MVCWSLRHRGEELLGQRDGLAAYAETGKTMGIPLLHPWANRLGAWSYEALGRSVDLEPVKGRLVRADRATGLPNHGTVPRPWRVVGDGVAELDGASEAFPFPHTVRIEASIDGGALRIATTVEAHDGPVPIAFGFHPYLALPGVARADWHVELPVTRRLVLSEQLAADRRDRAGRAVRRPARRPRVRRRLRRADRRGRSRSRVAAGGSSWPSRRASRSRRSSRRPART